MTNKDIAIILPFTFGFSAFTGGAATPFPGDGHIFIDTQLITEDPEAIIGSILHERTHVAQQVEGFANFDLALQVWAEAVAVAAMMAGMPDSEYWVRAHGPWPNNWTGGLAWERDRARQAGLWIRYLEENYSFNSCTFMQDNHAKLLAGDEFGAYEDRFPGLFETTFAKFVHAYNTRDSGLISGIELLSPAAAFLDASTSLPQFDPSQITSNEEWTACNFNGMKDGDTMSCTLDVGFDLAIVSRVAKRCPEHSVIVADFPADPTYSRYFSWLQTDGTQQESSSRPWSYPNRLVTLASPHGDAYVNELVYSYWPSSFGALPDYLPAPAVADPFPSGCP